MPIHALGTVTRPGCFQVAARCLVVAALVILAAGLWMRIPAGPAPEPGDTIIAPGETKDVQLSAGTTTLYWQARQKTPEIDLRRLAISATHERQDGSAAVIDLFDRFKVSTYVGDNLVWREIGVAHVREGGLYTVLVELDQSNAGGGALVIPAPPERDKGLRSGWGVLASSTFLLAAAAVCELVSATRRRHRLRHGELGDATTSVVDMQPSSLPLKPPWRPEA